jgi:hypothetical protein
MPRIVWYKLYWLWTPQSRTPNATFNWIHLLSYGAALPFMMAGLVLLIRQRGVRDGALLSIIAPLVATTAATVVFYGSARFRSTIEPFLLIFASVALLAIASRLMGARASATEAAE